MSNKGNYTNPYMERELKKSKIIGLGFLLGIIILVLIFCVFG